MTTGIAIFIIVIVTICLFVGYKMSESINKSIIEYKDIRIHNLEKQVDWYDKWTNTLFNEADMKTAYYQGRNDEYDVLQSPIGIKCDKVHPSETFDKWLEQKYKKVEPVTTPNEEDSSGLTIDV